MEFLVGSTANSLLNIPLLFIRSCNTSNLPKKLLVAEKTKFFATIEENEETYQDYLVKLNVKRLGGIMQYNIDKDI